MAARPNTRICDLSVIPSQAQQQALDALEQLGGKPVLLQENAKLPNQSKIHIASAAEPVHVLTYNPTAAPELPYHVCFQCRMAERAMRSAQDEKFNVAGTTETYSRVQKLVRQKKAIPDHMVETYSQMITDGLGVQLRSMPIGIRIDRQLYDTHPELRDLQKSAAERSMKEGVGCLQPSVRMLAPDKIFHASVGMNSAFALMWSRLWDDESHVVPYRLAGFLELGEKLLARLDSLPDSPTHDRELVSAWASILGIEDLYEIGPVGL